MADWITYSWQMTPELQITSIHTNIFGIYTILFLKKRRKLWLYGQNVQFPKSSVKFSLPINSCHFRPKAGR